MGHGSKETPTETQQETKGVYALLQTTFKGKEMKTFKQVLEMNINPNDKEEITASKKKIPKGYHRMPDGTLMKDSDHPKKLYKASYEEDDVTLKELSPAVKRARRLKRMNDGLRKAMKKYVDAAKAGIDPSRVHQRRTKLTLKKR